MIDLEALMDEELIWYREANQQEAIIAKHTISEHEGLVRLWLMALKQYHLGAKGDRTLTDPDEDKRIMQMARAQFAVLAGNHLQSALEDTLAGKYHHAGFSFRYVAELLIQSLYVWIRPEEARRWYPLFEKPGMTPRPPKLQTAWNCVQKYFSHPELIPMLPMVGVIHGIVKEMDEHGAHPSQATLNQLLDWQGDPIRIGPRYDDNKAIANLDRGLILTIFLLYQMDVLLPEDEWQSHVRLLWDERCALTRPLRQGLSQP